MTGEMTTSRAGGAFLTFRRLIDPEPRLRVADMGASKSDRPPEERGEPAGGPETSEAPDPEADLFRRVKEELAPGLELVRLLGRGVAASVYLAREPALRRLVAVKLLLPELGDDPKARLRFEREAQSAARIAHPNVVPLYRVGVLSDDLPYIVMQYVKGRSLADRLLAEGPLDPGVVRRILVDVASALDAAHRQKIVHRDVKPGNVLLEEETGRVLLTDFGIAAPLATGEFSPSRLTTRDRVLGDARYRSPEQLTGEEVTELADIYGLGLLGFELLTGEGPYEASTPTEWLAAHLHAGPRRPSDLRPEVDPDLEDLLLRCLSKVPEHRPGAADVVRQLASSGHGAPAPVPPTSPLSAAAGVADDGAGDVEEGEGREAQPTLALVPPGAPPPPPPAGVIRLEVLGALDVLAADGRRLLSVSAQPKRVALLTYLAIEGGTRFTRRDRLVGVFWPETEQERARHALRQALYVLKQGLGGDVLETRGDDEIRVASDQLWCDATAFEQAIAASRPREALDWYQGELLPGFYLEGGREFEHWLDTERTRLRRLASDAAWSVVEEEETVRNPVGAAHWARRAVELAPWDETSLCRLIDLLDRLGDRAGALHAYEQFSKRLASEYEAEPAPETQALARRVRAG